MNEEIVEQKLELLFSNLMDYIVRQSQLCCSELANDFQNRIWKQITCLNEGWNQEIFKPMS